MATVILENGSSSESQNPPAQPEAVLMMVEWLAELREVSRMTAQVLTRLDSVEATMQSNHRELVEMAEVTQEAAENAEAATVEAMEERSEAEEGQEVQEVAIVPAIVEEVPVLPETPPNPMISGIRKLLL